MHSHPVLQGKRVVRLKGGCPSTFSRVSGEMAALAAAGIPFQLVPGVSSALAAPLLAGPRHSASVTLLCRPFLGTWEDHRQPQQQLQQLKGNCTVCRLSADGQAAVQQLCGVERS